MSVIDDFKKKYSTQPQNDVIASFRVKYGSTQRTPGQQAGDSSGTNKVSYESPVVQGILRQMKPAEETPKTNVLDILKPTSGKAKAMTGGKVAADDPKAWKAPTPDLGTTTGITATFDDYTKEKARLSNLYAKAKQYEDAPLGMTREQRTGMDWGGFKSSVEIKDALDKLEADRTSLANKYYNAAGQEAVKKVESADTTDALQRAADAAVEIAELQKLLAQDGGHTKENDEKYGDALKRQEAAVNQLKTAGFSDEEIERALDYAVYVAREKKSAEEEKLWASEAKKNPLAAAVLARVAGVGRGADFVTAAVSSIGSGNPNDLKTYKPLPTADMTTTNMAGALDAGVIQRIEDETENETLEKIWTFAYQTGASIADSAMLAATMGGAASLVLGSGAAAQTTKEAIERGASTRQALTLGAAAGIAEAVFEKFSIEGLLAGKGDSKAILAILKQAGVEASEEMATEIANIIADTVIMQNNSNSKTSLKEYTNELMRSENLSREEAEAKAKQLVFLDNLKAVGLAGLAGAISGGVSMGGRVGLEIGAQKAVDYAVNNVRGRNIAYRVDLLNEAQKLNPDTEARQIADRIASIESRPGVTASNALWGKLATAFEAEADSAGTAKPDTKEAVTKPEAAPETTTESRPEVNTASAFMSQGDVAKVAETKSQIVARVLDGDTTLTDKDLWERLQLGTKSTRTVLNDLGIVLPASAEKKTLVAFMRNQVNSRAAEQQTAQTPTAEQQTPEAQQARLEELTEQNKSRAAEVLNAAVTAAEPAQAATTPEKRATAQVSGARTKTADTAANGKTGKKTMRYIGSGSANPTLKLSDGTTVTQAEFVERYLRANPGDTEADAVRAFSNTLEAQNRFGMEATAPDIDVTTRASAGNATPVAERNADQSIEGNAEQEVGQGEQEVGQDKQTASEVQTRVISSLDSAFKKAGMRVKVEGRHLGKEGVNGKWHSDGRIVLNLDRLNTQKQIYWTLAHELLHEAIHNSKDKTLVKNLLAFGENLFGKEKWAELCKQNRTAQIAAHAADIIEQAEKKGAKVAKEAAEKKAAAIVDKAATKDAPAFMDEENAADVLRIVLSETDALNDYVLKNRNTAIKIRDWLQNKLSDMLTGNISDEMSKRAGVMNDIVKRLDKALTRAEVKGQKTEQKTGQKNSVDADFADSIDRWDGKADTYFRLGSTSDVLKELGAADKSIVLRSAKLIAVLNAHKGMTRDIVKQVPSILENPMLVLNSRSASPENRGTSSRLVLFGEVYDNNGQPVTAILDLRPTLSGGEVQDYNLLVSTYGKDKNLKGMVESSEVLYLNPDKKRTDTWLHGLGLQSPSFDTKYGSMGSITYENGYVNISGVPWASLAPKNDNPRTRSSSDDLHDEEDRDMMDAPEAHRQFMSRFTGEVIAGEYIELTRREYSAIGHELKSGNGEIDPDGQAGCIHLFGYTYLFELTNKSAVLIFNVMSEEEYAAKQEIFEEEYENERNRAESNGAELGQTRSGYKNRADDFVPGSQTGARGRNAQVAEGEPGRRPNGRGSRLEGDSAGEVKFSPANDADINPDTGFEKGSLTDAIERTRQLDNEEEVVNLIEQVQDLLDKLREEHNAQVSKRRTQENLRPKLRQEDIERDRETLEKLITKYGEMKQTSGAQRESHLPKKIDANTKVRGAVNTVAGHSAVTDAIRNNLEHDIATGTIGTTYVPITDNEVLAEIREQIRTEEGFKAMRKQWDELVAADRAPTKRDIAVGEALLVQACSENRVDDAMRLIAEISIMGTRAGQTVQAFSLLKKMTPAGRAYYLQKTAEELNNSKSLRNRGIVVKLNQALVAEMMKAATTEEMELAESKLIADLAQQIPATFADKINAWRYLAMLANPRTHIRNIIGNAIFAPARFVSNALAAGIESKLLDEADRTKSASISREWREFAEADAESMKTELQGAGRYGVKDRVLDARPVFGNADLARTKAGAALSKTLGKATEWSRKGNSGAMEAEDWGLRIPKTNIYLPGLRSAYVKALGGFLQARGYTPADVFGEESTPEGRAALDQARTYAIREAKRATYRDMSRLATNLAYFTKNSGPLAKVLMGGLNPFVTTPINIGKRAVDYSILGLARSLANVVAKKAYGATTANREDGAVNVMNDWANRLARAMGGEKSSSEIIAGLCDGLTGTGIMLVGYFLAKAGALIGSLGDDDEDREKELQGYQEYSLTIGDKNITLDWMAPVALPLFVGAETFRLFEEKGLGNYDVLDAALSIFDPLFTMSMLDGINSTLRAVKYDDSDNPIVPIAEAMVGSYAGQFIPSVLGAVTRTVDPSRRSVFTPTGERGVKKWLDRWKQSNIQGKVPFESDERMLYVDEWGRTDTQSNILFRFVENFLSPGYVNTVNDTPVDEELTRLSTATKNTSVIPDKAKKSFTVDKQTYAMSQEEYEAHLLYRGQVSYDLLSALMNDPAYAGMTDEERVQVVNRVYTYASQSACYRTNSEYNRDNWVSELDQYTAAGGDAIDYLVMQSQTDKRTTISDIGFTRDDLTAAEMGTLILGDVSTAQRAPTSLTDPNRTGYEYTLNDEQVEWYMQNYDRRFNEEFPKLFNSKKYQRASAEERKEMTADLRKEIAEAVRKDTAKWLKSQGIKSTKK